MIITIIIIIIIIIILLGLTVKSFLLASANACTIKLQLQLEDCIILRDLKYYSNVNLGSSPDRTTESSNSKARKNNYWPSKNTQQFSVHLAAEHPLFIPSTLWLSRTGWEFGAICNANTQSCFPFLSK